MVSMMMIVFCFVSISVWRCYRDWGGDKWEIWGVQWEKNEAFEGDWEEREKENWTGKILIGRLWCDCGKGNERVAWVIEPALLTEWPCQDFHAMHSASSMRKFVPVPNKFRYRFCLKLSVQRFTWRYWQLLSPTVTTWSESVHGCTVRTTST